MDDKTYNMIDGIIATQGYQNDREAAMDILKLATREGTLLDAAKVVAGRYALQTSVVLEWFAEALNRRIKDAEELIEKMKNMGQGDDGSK